MRTIFRYLPLIALALSCDSSSSDKETPPVAAELQPVTPPVLSTPAPVPAPVPAPEPVSPPPPPPPPVSTAEPVPAPTFAEVYTSVLKPKCVGCHNSNVSAGDISLETREGVLATKDLVSCGQPEDSLLYQVVESNKMPFGKPPLGTDEKKLIALWIEGNCL